MVETDNLLDFKKPNRWIILLPVAVQGILSAQTNWTKDLFAVHIHEFIHPFIIDNQLSGIGSQSAWGTRQGTPTIGLKSLDIT